MAEESDVMAMFKLILIVSLFFSVSITLLTYALPGVSRPWGEIFTNTEHAVTLEDVSSQVEDSMSQQSNIPVVELGALVFYSGNILIDLLLNFAFALPEMIGLLLKGLGFLLPINAYVMAIVEVFAGVMIMVFYAIGLMQLLTGVYSGRAV